MLIDNSIATIGTANFDNRSFRLNFEFTAVIADTEFATEVEQMFQADFEKSRLMESGEADDKSWWFRFGVRLARLTAPLQRDSGRAGRHLLLAGLREVRAVCCCL
jgi:cardiolipin synthase